MFRVDRLAVDQGCQGLCVGDRRSEGTVVLDLPDVTNDMNLKRRHDPIFRFSSLADHRLQARTTHDEPEKPDLVQRAGGEGDPIDLRHLVFVESSKTLRICVDTLLARPVAISHRTEVYTPVRCELKVHGPRWIDGLLTIRCPRPFRKFDSGEEEISEVKPASQMRPTEICLCRDVAISTLPCSCRGCF